MSDETLKKLFYDLVDVYRPFENRDERELKEAKRVITGPVNYALTSDEVKSITDEIDKVLVDRLARAIAGPSFVSNERVQVIEEITWWNKATAARAPVGTIGMVLAPSVPISSQHMKNDFSYAGLVPVRFHSTDLGYEWEEGDDPDWEFITYNMPNYVLQRVR